MPQFRSRAEGRSLTTRGGRPSIALLTVVPPTITVALRREACCPRNDNPAGRESPGERRNYESTDALLVGVRLPPRCGEVGRLGSLHRRARLFSDVCERRTSWWLRSRCLWGAPTTTP